ncbi:MAG: hypothetical protein QME70_07900 [Bacillota bacterium]|nr:hypothetical protein [Bacillota bacterium]
MKKPTEQPSNIILSTNSSLRRWAVLAAVSARPTFAAASFGASYFQPVVSGAILSGRR